MLDISSMCYGARVDPARRSYSDYSIVPVLYSVILFRVSIISQEIYV